MKYVTNFHKGIPGGTKTGKINKEHVTIIVVSISIIIALTLIVVVTYVRYLRVKRNAKVDPIRYINIYSKFD